MRDVVLDTTAGSFRRITPKMLGNELFQTPFLRPCRRTHGLSRQRAPLAADLPFILEGLTQFVGFDVVPHRKVLIILAVCQTSCHRNCVSGHHLGDENDPSAILAAFFVTHIEAEIYLIEIRVKWNRETAKQLGAAEPKSDKAEVGSPLE